MARTLSDTIIISMIEAATRLASGRGPISGSGAPGAHPSPSHSEAGGPVGQESGATTDAAQSAGTTANNGASAGASSAPPRGEERDARSAEQIGHDFQAIYRQIEDVVKSSAEQETKAVGFGTR